MNWRNMLLPCAASTTSSHRSCHSSHARQIDTTGDSYGRISGDTPQGSAPENPAQTMRLENVMASTRATPKVGLEYLVNIEQLETGQKRVCYSSLPTVHSQHQSLTTQASPPYTHSLLRPYQHHTAPHRSAFRSSLSLGVSVSVSHQSGSSSNRPGSWKFRGGSSLGYYVSISAGQQRSTTSSFAQVLSHCFSHAKDPQLSSSRATTSEGLPRHEAP
jgi:hypothetical protein